MEEMQNLNVENTVTDIVEVTTDKLTFKENVIAYGLAGIFVTGLVTVGYLGYKGTKKLANKIRDKRESKVVEISVTDDNVIKENDEHEDDNNDTEE